MTDIIQLFSGIGVVIDEAINATENRPNGIQKIVQSIKEKNIPVLEYEELPPDEIWPNFHSISFVVLDWNLSGVRPIPNAAIEDNIDFIKKLEEICFVPIFIFSDEDPHSIEVSLSENGITTSNNPIFIKKKDEIDNVDKLFKTIEEWIRVTPSVYVLKEWELATRLAQTEMLSELGTINPCWPSVLATTIQDDGAGKNWELMNLLQNNLSNRIIPPQFEDAIIKSESTEVTREIIRKILECERFLKNDKLPEYPLAGDIYLIDGCYHVNIRPDCDIIREKKDLYLLKGDVIDDAKIKSGIANEEIVFKHGEFQEKVNNCIVPFVDGKILSFSLRKLSVKKWNDLKDKRLGRLLPPFITKIQQKYSFYIQRQGLPRIPDEAIFDNVSR